MESDSILPDEDGFIKFEPLSSLPTDEDGAVKFKTIDEAIRCYVEERDKLRAESAAFNSREADRKERMSMISMFLRDKGDEIGVDSFKTQYGTAYRNVKTSYRVGDWTAIMNWIKVTGNYQILEKRVAKNATKEIHDMVAKELAEIDQLPTEAEKEFASKKFIDMFHMDPATGGVPPGIMYSTEVEFDVRRPTKAKGE